MFRSRLSSSVVERARTMQSRPAAGGLLRPLGAVVTPSSLSPTTGFSPNATCTTPVASFSTYRENKAAAKERRRKLYLSRQERKERVKIRQKNRPNKGIMRRKFNEWFDKKRVWDYIQDKKARQAGMDFRLQVVNLIERQPVIERDYEQWQKDWIELDNYLGQWGKEYPEEFNPRPMLPPLSDEELFEQLPEEFTPAPRRTEADHSGETGTHNRKLDERVYLMFPDKKHKKTTDDKEDRWVFPKTWIQEDETIFDAAKRTIPPEIRCWYPSQQPCAADIWGVQDPPEGYFGVKTFFLKMYLDEGDDDQINIVQGKHAWLSRGEISDYFGRVEGHGASRFYHYLL